MNAKQQPRPEVTRGATPIAGLPASLAGSRVLTLGPSSPEYCDRFTELGAEIVAQESSPTGPLPGALGSFDFVHCRALPANGRQLVVLARLWRLAAPGASLLLGSRIFDDVEGSRYLRVESTSAAGLEWIPGRLALRWMVESSGFDVLRWLAEETADSGRSEPFALLTASRSDRLPVFLEQAGSSPGDDSFRTAEDGAGSAAPNGRHLDGPQVQRVLG